MDIINEKRVEKMRVIYKNAEKFLLEITPIELRGKELEKYFHVEKKFKSKSDILTNLLGSLQNRQMSKNVIGFWSESKKHIFKDILFDYDIDAILGAYNEDTLLECFEKHFSIKNTDSKGNLWKLYAKSIISGCKFLRKFDDANDFDDFINRFSYNEFSSAALPMLLEKEIFGLGFALACDFLKELGYTQYPKPDVHIKDIFHAFSLCEKNDYSAYKAVIEMARIVNQTPYKVDKIFWLIGSGDYYYHNKKIEGNKDKFIETNVHYIN